MYKKTLHLLSLLFSLILLCLIMPSTVNAETTHGEPVSVSFNSSNTVYTRGYYTDHYLDSNTGEMVIKPMPVRCLELPTFSEGDTITVNYENEDFPVTYTGTPVTDSSGSEYVKFVSADDPSDIIEPYIEWASGPVLEYHWDNDLPFYVYVGTCRSDNDYYAFADFYAGRDFEDAVRYPDPEVKLKTTDGSGRLIYDYKKQKLYGNEGDYFLIKCGNTTQRFTYQSYSIKEGGRTKTVWGFVNEDGLVMHISYPMEWQDEYEAYVTLYAEDPSGEYIYYFVFDTFVGYRPVYDFTISFEPNNITLDGEDILYYDSEDDEWYYDFYSRSKHELYDEKWRSWAVPGDKLTINYDDGTSRTYTNTVIDDEFDPHDAFVDGDEVLDVWPDAYQLQPGNNVVKIWYLGVSTKINVFVKTPDYEAANKIMELIKALPDANSVKLSDKAAINAARKAYDSLTAAQKALVSNDILAKLKAAEQSLSSIESAKAKADAEAAANARSAAIASASNINKRTVSASDIKKATDLGVNSITLGPKVKKIKKNAFKGSTITTVTVKTKKLKAKTVKGSLKGSKVKTIKVKIGSKSVNKKFVKKYKKIFTKKNAGRKAKVK